MAYDQFPAADDGPEVVRDPGSESKLRAIALWYAMFGSIPVTVAFFGRELQLTGAVQPWIQAAGGVAVGIVFVGEGHFLSEFSDAARIVAKAAHVLALLNAGYLGLSSVSWLSRLPENPQLLILGLGVIWIWANLAFYTALSSPGARRVCRPEYGEAAKKSPILIGAVFRSPFFWAPLASGALGGAAVLLFG